MSRIWPISFNKRFVALIEDGMKHQTIRAERKDGKVPVVGDRIHCYFGLRTKHTRMLRQATITSVHQVVINIPEWEVWVDGNRMPMHGAGPDKFARADGFQDFKDMMTWWQRTHAGPRFTGFMIKWGGV